MESPFRIVPADPSTLEKVEENASEPLSTHLDLIKDGLEELPGVPREALYSAVTLRTLALKPELFRTWFETEYYSVKEGELETSTKELLAAIISWKIEGEETPACAPYHEGAARHEGADPEALEVVQDYESNRDALGRDARKIIDFGLKVAFETDEITDAEVASLKSDLELSDGALVELVSTSLIASNLASVNQVFDLVEGADQPSPAE